MKKLMSTLVLLLTIFLWNFNQNQQFTPQFQTHYSNTSLKIIPTKTAATQANAPLNQHQLFTSEDLQSDFPFTTVALSWQLKTSHQPADPHQHTHGPGAQIRFKNQGQYSAWLDLEPEQDLVDPNTTVALASTNTADAFQYRFFLNQDQEINDLSWTFLKTSPDLKPKVASDFTLPQGAVLSGKTPNIISRSQWGADESYRYLKPGEELVLAPRDEDFYFEYADELTYQRTIYEDNKGRYRWPLSYPEQVKKIIIHHTATTKDLDNPAAAISDIYFFHANTRGWGDIGYNYIIDRQGAIYEGRAGGEGVIGAHAPFANHGSIGIAVLGHYDQNDVPEKSVIALTNLISNKSKIHDIQPDGNNLFRKQNLPNILGHKDVDATSCPGEKLYDKLPIIRKLSAQEVQEKQKFITDYDFQVKNPLTYLEIDALQKQTLTLQFENIGKKTWNQDTFILISDDPNNHKLLEFPTSQSYILANQNEQSVAPGEIATFTFDVQAKTLGGSAYLQFHPMIDGRLKLENNYILPVGIIPPVYNFQTHQSIYPPSEMKRGQQANISISLKNLSNVPWQKAGDNAITLQGTNLNLTLDQDTVDPNQIATFSATFDAPALSGLYAYTFTPHVPGVTFQNKDTFTFQTRVYNRPTEATLKIAPKINKFQKNSSNNVTFRIKNTGITPLDSKNIQLNLHTNQQLKFQNLSFSKNTFAPDETLEISFDVNTTNQETGFFFINPLYQGTALLNKPIKITYSSNPLQTPDDLIRIKLSFQGIPEITANTDYDVYRQGQLIESKQALSSIIIEDPLTKIIPQNNGILTIKNYENRPAWNPDLNDNQFRGSLELINDDGVLTLVNELPLEDYLKGLGEVSNSAEPEKIKALMVAARTYAKYYQDVDRKFPNKPYDLDDDPQKTQKYLGYGLEKRSPNVSKGVQDTAGEVVTYNGTLVKTPYFNQTDGTTTKSAQEVWGWTNTPYLQSVDDSLCDGEQFLGHGVGLSGCGATEMAKNGSTYRDILQHYYTGIEIVKL